MRSDQSPVAQPALQPWDMTPTRFSGKALSAGAQPARPGLRLAFREGTPRTEPGRASAGQLSGDLLAWPSSRGGSCAHPVGRTCGAGATAAPEGRWPLVSTRECPAARTPGFRQTRGAPGHHGFLAHLRVTVGHEPIGLRAFEAPTARAGASQLGVGGRDLRSSWPFEPGLYDPSWSALLQSRSQGPLCTNSGSFLELLGLSARTPGARGTDSSLLPPLPSSTSDTSPYRVLLGARQLAVPGPHAVSARVKRVESNPLYQGMASSADVALVELEAPVTFTRHVLPVCLPDSSVVFEAGTSCWVTGWGSAGEQDQLPNPRVLQKLAVPIIDTSSCNRLYSKDAEPGLLPKTVREDMLCAGFAEGQRDACKGDSGGPLVCLVGQSWLQAGVISWGEGCARRNRPGVYIQVAAHRRWIHRVIPELQFQPSRSGGRERGPRAQRPPGHLQPRPLAADPAPPDSGQQQAPGSSPRAQAHQEAGRRPHSRWRPSAGVLPSPPPPPWAHSTDFSAATASETETDPLLTFLRGPQFCNLKCEGGDVGDPGTREVSDGRGPPPVPSAPPRKVEAEALNATAIRVLWRSPAPGRQHGQIRGYQVHYVRMEGAEARGPPRIKDVMLADAQAVEATGCLAVQPEVVVRSGEIGSPSSHVRLLQPAGSPASPPPTARESAGGAHSGAHGHGLFQRRGGTRGEPEDKFLKETARHQDLPRSNTRRLNPSLTPPGPGWGDWPVPVHPMRDGCSPGLAES
ncbi:PREDICTED: uncharacterized protein LOC101621909 [Condylura cristata]|uniref:uncharacterized protein LOC101621909 n=1 Tax=Condylura cristata TaxID=143302 RepID=UPI00064327CF|nr:PREDICTED: uncharacterized protein LOC101621909 [Condylura cristata]